MELRTKLKLNGEMDAGNLVRAFFRDFNAESSITIKGNEANLDIFFHFDTPDAIIEAISHCEIIEFSYAKPKEKAKENDDANKERKVIIVEKKKNSKKVEEPPKESSKTQKEKAAEETNNSQIEFIIPEVLEIAKNSFSFDDFVKNVCHWLELEKRQMFFTCIIYAACQNQKVSWKGIKEIFEQNGWHYRDTDKIACSNMVSDKFNNSTEKVTILVLIKEIVKYQNYNFKPIEAETISNEETVVLPKVEEVAEGVASEVSLTMQENARISDEYHNEVTSMFNIPSFEEILKNVDKTQSVEERVYYILNAMGFENESANDQHFIYAIVDTGVRQKKISFDIIFIKAYIDMKDTQKAKKKLSEFINRYANKNGFNERVTILPFLKELQKHIMLDNELEDFDDFTD